MFSLQGDLFNPRLIGEIVFQFVVVLVLAVFIGIRCNAWIAGFLVLVLFSSIFPFSTKFSTEAFRNVFYAVILYTVVSLSVKERNYCYIYNIICVLAILNVLVAIVHLLNIQWYIIPAKGDVMPVVGLTNNRNELSALLAICFPAFLRPRWAWFIPMVVFGLIIAKSFGGILTVGIIVIVYAYLKSNLYLSLALILCALLFYILIIDAPGMERLLFWKTGLNLYKQHWFLGSGVGHWKVVFAQESQMTVIGSYLKRAHSEYLQGLFEMGIPFALLCGGYCYGVFKQFHMKNIIPFLAIIAIMVSSMIHFTFHIAESAAISLTWMGLYNAGRSPQR